MKLYEVTREIYNPCAGQFYYDNNFPPEIESENLEDTLRSYLGSNFPEYNKEIISEDTVVFILKLPRQERFTFTEI
ncbi:MAG: hypothetical protein RSG52_09040 [Terrisporobacter sp.]|uniref:hypothetical protein n=1 Tax=Terrisporobacter sp. TaxID=1965305 RepID=UPI002FC735BD